MKRAYVMANRMQPFIDRLAKGETIVIKGCGNSMNPRFKHGEKIIISPVNRPIEVGDAVKVKVKGTIYEAHLVKAKKGEQYLISNIKGRENGWVKIDAIYGIAIGKEKKK